MRVNGATSDTANHPNHVHLQLIRTGFGPTLALSAAGIAVWLKDSPFALLQRNCTYLCIHDLLTMFKISDASVESNDLHVYSIVYPRLAR